MPVLHTLRGLGRDVASRRSRHDGARSRRRPRVAGPDGHARSACPTSRWCWSSGRTSTAARYWLVLQEGVAPYGCVTDPLLDAERYVYVQCALATLLALARGRQELAGRARRRLADS